MRIVGSELAAIAFFILVGWLSLWPVRRRLGPWTYHLAALPTGLLASSLAVVVSSLTRRRLDLLSAVAGALLLIAALWVAERLFVDRDGADGASVGLRSFAVALGGLAVFGVIFGFARITITNYDPVTSYWPLGVQLSRNGAITAALMSSRSPLIPGMNAVHIAFGSDFAYLIYPMLAITLALWLVMTLWVGPSSGSHRRAKLLVAGGVLVFVGLEPSFLYNAFFVHSQLMSAAYLLMSLTCIWMAVRPDGKEAEAALFILAGMFAAGLALSRPDGPAYLFVPVAAAISALTISKVRWRLVAAFFASLMFLVVSAYAAAFANIGLWSTQKLSGGTSLAILAVLCVAAASPWIVERIDRLLPVRVSGERFFAVLVSVAVVMMLAVFALNGKTAVLALVTARINLFQGAGGYNYLWYAVVGLLVLSAFTGDALRSSSWTRPAFLSLMLLFVIAGVVHGTSHAGRIGPGDSLNRVVFEFLPVVVWYVAAIAARILASPGDARPSEA